MPRAVHTAINSRCKSPTFGAGFLLGPAGVDGGVEQAEVVAVRGGGYAVQVDLDRAAADALGDLVGGLVGSEGRFAVVVDGTHLTLDEVIDEIVTLVEARR